VIGNNIIPVVFEVQGSVGGIFERHFEDCLLKRAEELGMKSPGPLPYVVLATTYVNCIAETCVTDVL